MYFVYVKRGRVVITGIGALSRIESFWIYNNVPLSAHLPVTRGNQEASRLSLSLPLTHLSRNMPPKNKRQDDGEEPFQAVILTDSYDDRFLPISHDMPRVSLQNSSA